MAKANKLKTVTKFRVWLGNMLTNTPIEVVGKAMSVNHRGDLLIHESTSTSYNNAYHALAAFKSGSWVRAEKFETNVSEEQCEST